MEKIGIFGLLDVEMEATGTGNIYLSTDMPGNAMAVRETRVFSASGRRTLRFRLAGTTKGHVYRVKIAPGSGAMRLYGAKIWGRVLPEGRWGWWPVPVIETPTEWIQVPLPIPETPPGWTPVDLPIPATSSEWSAVPLPIPETPTDWTPVKLPIKETPVVPSWLSVPIDG